MKNAPKTINNEYIQNISKSEEFINQFQNYLLNHLKNDYSMQIKSKFDGLVKKWEHEIEHSQSE